MVWGVALLGHERTGKSARATCGGNSVRDKDWAWVAWPDTGAKAGVAALLKAGDRGARLRTKQSWSS
jgi:hypothetical protein